MEYILKQLAISTHDDGCHGSAHVELSHSSPMDMLPLFKKEMKMILIKEPAISGICECSSFVNNIIFWMQIVKP